MIATEEMHQPLAELKIEIKNKFVGAKTENKLKGTCLRCKVNMPLNSTLAGDYICM